MVGSQHLIPRGLGWLNARTVTFIILNAKDNTPLPDPSNRLNRALSSHTLFSLLSSNSSRSLHPWPDLVFSLDHPTEAFSRPDVVHVRKVLETVMGRLGSWTPRGVEVKWCAGVLGPPVRIQVRQVKNGKGPKEGPVEPEDVMSIEGSRAFKQSVVKAALKDEA